MAFCGHCGTQIENTVKFCPGCGQATAAAAAQQAQTQQTQTQAQPPPQAYAQAQQQYPHQAYAQPIVPGAPQQADIRDAQDNKTMSVLAYLIFFIPLIAGAHKTSAFVKYHTNQGTALFLLSLAYSVLSGILRSLIKTPVTVLGIVTTVYTTPGWLSTLLFLLSIPICILCVMGIINAVNGRMRPLPYIGHFTFIK